MTNWDESERFPIQTLNGFTLVKNIRRKCALNKKGDVITIEEISQFIISDRYGITVGGPHDSELTARQDLASRKRPTLRSTCERWRVVRSYKGCLLWVSERVIYESTDGESFVEQETQPINFWVQATDGKMHPLVATELSSAELELQRLASPPPPETSSSFTM